MYWLCSTGIARFTSVDHGHVAQSGDTDGVFFFFFQVTDGVYEYELISFGIFWTCR